ncbi:MAG: tetratricopeptide repeat protein, partial [Candidatus Delongbacteria bacterium]|nr:tetratricopeptide repeat protein [Candidatus Delongbacteria bacterium]
KSESYLFEAEILKILEKRDKAIELCEKVKKSFDRGHKLFDKAVALNAFLLFKSNLYDKVLKEVKLFSKNTDINVFAQGYSFKGFAELFSGKTGNSEKTASKLYSLKNKVSDPKIKAIILNLSGNINLHKRNITIARAYFEDMLKIAIDNNLSDERLKALQNISVCHANAGEYKKAKEFLEKLYEEAVRIHNYDLIIVSINNIANMAYATGEYKSAERLAEKGLKIAQKYKKHILIDDILCCLANIKLKQGTIEEAL